MPSSSQRQTRLKLDLGGEQVELVRVESTEGLSQPFSIELEILSKFNEIDLLPHLGKPAVVSVHDDEKVLRYFHGILVEGVFLREIDGDGFLYRLSLRPKSLLHEQGRSFRIFQEQTVRAILEETFEWCGIKSDPGRLVGGTRVRSYCVQYGESDFGFACRLMEEEGIYYYYAHTKDDHVLVLCDSPGAHGEGEASPLTYNPASGSMINADWASRSVGEALSFVQRWHERVTTGAEAKVTMRDFDFMRPNESREVTVSAPEVHPDDQIEIYAYPGRYYAEADGEALSTALLESRRANRRTFTGHSQQPAIACGTTFMLEGHIDRFNRRYMITSVQHMLASEQYRSGTGGQEQSVQFEAIPADARWRAPIVTRRPAVLGPETAIVTGPPGEEIYVDKYGRVKVQFHWDRDGKKDDNSSCWIRVSQTGGLGNIIIPRVGHEVLVDFINGDPDRPIVVGRVFNESHMPIYPLPANKTRVLWRTMRYGQTGIYNDTKRFEIQQTGANEIRFEDKGGVEEIFVQAERDMNTVIHHDETVSIGHNQTIVVGYDRAETVGHDESITIGNNRTETVGKDENITIGENRSEMVGKNETITIGENQSISIGKNLKMNVGKTIEIEAGTKIVLKVGDSTITIDEKSIKAGTLQFTAEGSAQAKVTSPLTTVEGTGNLFAKGGMVMIN